MALTLATDVLHLQASHRGNANEAKGVKAVGHAQSQAGVFKPIQGYLSVQKALTAISILYRTSTVK